MKNSKKKKGRLKPVIQKIDPDYMDVNECAKFLDISVSHLYKLTSRRKIPHIKFLRKKLIFDRDKISKWIMSKEISVKK